MGNRAKLEHKQKALRFALRIARTDRRTPKEVVAYLIGKVAAYKANKPAYRQLPMFTILGQPHGRYRCVACGRMFGENLVSHLQSKRAYLTLHCPHCLTCWYTDKSQ